MSRVHNSFPRWLAMAGAVVTLLGGAATARATGLPLVSGGAALSALAPHATSTTQLPVPGKTSHGTWMSGVTITEYWPVPEKWFVGKAVTAPGLPGTHRIDWLYSATGLSMQGEGVGLDGRMYHINALGNEGWVTAAGQSTSAALGWSAGSPYWRAGGYWRNSSGAVTFPLAVGGWSAGAGRKYVPIPGVTFASGASLPLHYYQSIAVDPHRIPLGSRVYIPAYRHDGHGGWFVAQDTGGAIKGRHLDVFRPPPASPSVGGQYLVHQRILVVKPSR